MVTARSIPSKIPGHHETVLFSLVCRVENQEKLPNFLWTPACPLNFSGRKGVVQRAKWEDK